VAVLAGEIDGRLMSFPRFFLDIYEFSEIFLDIYEVSMSSCRF
jgi:hypothetical protein